MPALLRETAEERRRPPALPDGSPSGGSVSGLDSTDI
jgi:hypothetical protein